jgi:hypothetical protein
MKLYSKPLHIWNLGPQVKSMANYILDLILLGPYYNTFMLPRILQQYLCISLIILSKTTLPLT